MKLLRAFPTLAFLFLPLVTSCGERPGADEVPAAEEEAPLSEVPEAQAAYDEALELWGTDNPASMAKAYEAVALDPGFVEAYGYLSDRYAWIHQNWDRSDSIADQALAHAQKAMELDPDNYASVGSMGDFYYRIEKDYATALEYYSRGAELYPEGTGFLRMQAHVARRMGDWDGALQLLLEAEEKASTLDGIKAIAENHEYGRRWDQAADYFNRYAERNPESTFGPSRAAWVDYKKSGDTGPIRAFLETRPTGWSLARWNVEMLDRDFESALAAVDASSTEVYNTADALAPRSSRRAIALRRLGREAEAVAAFEEAKATMEAMLPELDHDPRVHTALGQILAELGQREEAIREGERAVELMPPERDAILGPNAVAGLATIYALLGEAESAAEHLRYLLSVPSDIFEQGLRTAPVWDNIRDHAAFQALLTG